MRRIDILRVALPIVALIVIAGCGAPPRSDSADRDHSADDAVRAVFREVTRIVGLPITSEQAVRSLSVQGRAAMVGLASAPTPLDMYRDLIGKEGEIIGVSDHLPEEIDELISLVQQGRLDIAPVISKTIPLDETAVNRVFEELDNYSGASIRTVISLE